MIEVILAKIDALLLTAEERAVVSLLTAYPITQGQIAKSERWIGTHPKHEEYDGDTTKRMVREIIRTLRVKYKVPILSDHSGYWLPKRVSQIQEYLERTEREVRARNRASLETYQALRLSCEGVQSAYFDQQAALEDKAEPPKQVELF